MINNIDFEKLKKLEAEREYTNLVSSSNNFENKVEMAQSISDQKLYSSSFGYLSQFFFYLA